MENEVAAAGESTKTAQNKKKINKILKKIIQEKYTK